MVLNSDRIRSHLRRLLLFATLAAILADVTESPPPVRFTAPRDGDEVDSAKTLTFAFELHSKAPELSTPASPILCLTVQNKRVSYEAWTKCFEGGASPTSFDLTGGLTPGVWCARTYLVDKNEPQHWRGGHQNRVWGTEHTIWFVVDKEAWVAEARLDPESFAVPQSLARRGSANLDEGSVGGGAAHSEVSRFKRLHIFEIANSMAESALVRSTTLAASAASPWAPSRRHVALTMTNEGHLDLTLNLLSSLRRHKVPAVAFALDAPTALALAAVQVPTVRVPAVPGFCPHCARGHRDVWSAGFADIAALKPACVLTVLRLGVDALWLDTDIVVFRNPFPELWAATAGEDVSLQVICVYEAANEVKGSKSASTRFLRVLFPHCRRSEKCSPLQVGGSHDMDVPVDVLDAHRSDLCSGLYLAKSGAATASLFEQVIQVISMKEADVKFGDQAAMNLVIHEARWRGGLGSALTVGILDALVFPTGGVYFKGLATGQISPRSGVAPALVHNNYLIGLPSKVARFRENGLWFMGHDDTESPLHSLHRSPGIDVLCGLSGSASMPGIASSVMFILGETVSMRPLIGISGGDDGGDDESRNVLWAHPCTSGIRLVVVVSLGPRPWVTGLILPRLRHYAASTKADLLVLRRLGPCSEDGVDANACAKLYKLRAAHAALGPQSPLSSHGTRAISGYERVAVVDDTMLFRRDAPDVFGMVSPSAVGAAVEDWRVRPPGLSATFLELSLLKHGHEGGGDVEALLLETGDIASLVRSKELGAPEGCRQGASSSNGSSNGSADDEGAFFNTGFLVLGRELRCLVSDPVPRGAATSSPLLDFTVLWDQGLLNARRCLLGAPLHDLGLGLNWVGSFNGTNAHKRPFDAVDAHAVHATTGLPDFGAGREEFLRYIDDAWGARGI